MMDGSNTLYIKDSRHVKHGGGDGYGETRHRIRHHRHRVEHGTQSNKPATDSNMDRETREPESIKYTK